MKRSSNNRKTKERSMKKDAAKHTKIKHIPVPTDYFFSNYADKVNRENFIRLETNKKINKTSNGKSPKFRKVESEGQNTTSTNFSAVTNNLKISNTNRLSYQKPSNNFITNGVTENATKNDYDTDSSTLSKAAIALRSGKMSLCNDPNKSKTTQNKFLSKKGSCVDDNQLNSAKKSTIRKEHSGGRSKNRAKQQAYINIDQNNVNNLNKTMKMKSIQNQLREMRKSSKKTECKGKK